MEATPEADHSISIRRYSHSYPVALPFGCLRLAGVFDSSGQISELREMRPKVLLVRPTGGWVLGCLGLATWDHEAGSAMGSVA